MNSDDKNLFKANANSYFKEESILFIHTSIRTSNMDHSIDFYTNLLGLKVISRREILQTNAEITFLQDPLEKGAKLELTFYKDQKKFVQAEYEDRLFDHIAFEVEDMDKTLTVMRERNVIITDEPYRLSPNGALIAFIEDPDGTLIELIEKKTISK